MAKTRPGTPPPLPAAPDRQSLHEAALRHLARFAATEAGLVRVLDRRIARWARAAGAAEDEVAPARRAAREVAAALAAAGVVDDAKFAEARARRLVRAGRSRRAVSAHLAAKGVGAEASQAAMPDAAAEILAAIAFVRRRRLGAFAPDADRARQLAALARAGFPRDIAERALATGKDEAEAMLLALKQG